MGVSLVTTSGCPWVPWTREARLTPSSASTRLFIDPLLLRRWRIPELADVARVIDERLGNILTLLAASNRRGDMAWRNAERLMTFPQVKGLCIGYSSRGMSDSGMGPDLRSRLLATAKVIVDAGIDDPALFELMGLLEEGIGPDRMSDMFAGIALLPIARFSARVFADVGVAGEDYTVRGEELRLPTNPFNSQPMLLVPMDVLRVLPVAEDWSEVDDVVAHNRALRDQVKAMVGGSWKEASDEVVRAYNAMFQHIYKADSKGQNPREMMRLWSNVLLAIRRSAGTPDTRLDEWDMLTATIKDNETLRNPPPDPPLLGPRS